jgi:putative transcriptional regulator
MASLAGSFLVARPTLQDPSFVHAVVLVLQHGDSGAFGLMVNRLAKASGVPYPVFSGGPCPSEGLLMLHGHPDWLEEASEAAQNEVAPGIYMGDASCLTKISDPEPGKALRFRMVNGYAGWGPGQLERELASGAWGIVPATAELLFDTPSADLWDRLAPPAIPQPSLN